ncbi:MAG: universal stress protein [Candidatus Marinimicrobia bacterium]|nr:universal stress protein [Candidatus Neomarinimicrobiota bacterium]
MKILIAISSKEYSKPTLQVGMWAAKAFNASVTIAYVGQKISAFGTSDVGLAQESIAKWGIERPGVRVLEWAFNYLAENKYITPDTVKAGFQRNTLVDRGKNRVELHLKGNYCEGVDLILRRGDIIPELRNEVAQNGYDITVIGRSKKRRMAHDLVQYVDSSIYIARDLLPFKEFRLLQAVDDSKGTAKALLYGSQVAKVFNMPVDVLTVSKRDSFGKGYMGAHKKAIRTFEKVGIKPVSLLKVGDPVNTILDIATKNHLIVMGISHLNPIIQFFKGSKPLNVMKKCNSPMMIVK